MKNINEKYGYLDQNSLKLNDLTDKVVNILNDDTLMFEDTYMYVYKDHEHYYKTDEGLEFYTFIYQINDTVIKNVKIIIVKYTDKNKIHSNSLFNLFANDAFGFYAVKYSTTNIGYIYLSYNVLKEQKNIRKEVKDTLYHEIRHYYDDLKKIIPRYKNKTKIIKNDHYINVLAEEVLNINANSYESEDHTKNINDNDNNFVNDILYVMEPTELNGHFHSFVIQLAAYKNKLKKEGKKLTLKNVKSFLVNGYLKHSIYMGLVYAAKPYFTSEEEYKKIVTEFCNTDYAAYIYYFNKMLSSIKTNSAWLKSQNKQIEQKLLHGKNPYMDDISKELAEKVIKTYIDNYFISYVYRQMKPYIKTVYKNLDKVISAAITED